MKRHSGFTLVELLVVLAIAAILVALAVPSFGSLIRSTQIASAVNAFLSDTRFARSEAVRLGGTVTMCRSSNPETSATSGPTCANASPSTVGWESGWIVFLDQNHDGTRDYNSDSALDDRLLRVHGPNTSLNLINDSGGATKLKFTSTGRLLNVSSATTLTFGASDGASLVKYVCIGLGGRARIGTDAEPCP